jgi:hypothetical protein
MSRYIVTTTINPPTIALKKYIEFQRTKGWKLIVVGDLKTPHDEHMSGLYQYMTPEEQMDKYPELSEYVGWNSISRRSLGIVEAYKQGAQVFALVDDDNIPYDDWSDDLYIGQTITYNQYATSVGVFDPLAPTSRNDLWHRGFPIQYLQQRGVMFTGQKKKFVKVQADLWDGDPDIDAICRIAFRPIVKFEHMKPYGSIDFSPFNSQNTFLSRTVIPDYMLFPHTGRMDDIWASYVMEARHKDCVIYNRASVYQDRNQHDLVVDLEKEMLGYRKTQELLFTLASRPDDYREVLPTQAKRFEEIYRRALGL